MKAPSTARRGTPASVLGALGIEFHWPPAARALNALRYRLGRRWPWSGGYSDYRNRFVAALLADSDSLAPFQSGAALPPGFGVGLDERCVEWPWFITHARQEAREYLDAGATLNHRHILGLPFWREKRITILTLAPESEAFWRMGVSYQFADLRSLPFRDAWFDEAACLSTLEHVGMDNSFYAPDGQQRPANVRDFEFALRELRRVLKPGGRLLLTVPFGKYQNWGLFQQFDAALLDGAAEAFAPTLRKDVFYRYNSSGWQIAARDECCDCGFSEYMIAAWRAGRPARPPDPDRAAGARAVACCIWQRD